MVDRDFKDDTEAGFCRYGQDKDSKGLLLPTAVAKAIEADAAFRQEAIQEALEHLAAASRVAQAEAQALQEAKAQKQQAKLSQRANSAKDVPACGAAAGGVRGMPLPPIRIHSPHELADAVSFARGFLAKTMPPGVLPAQVSEDLLVAVLLVSAYRYPDYAMADVLFYLVDPLWDAPEQILHDVRNTCQGLAQAQTAAWFQKFDEQIAVLLADDTKNLTRLLQMVHLHWFNAMHQPVEAGGVVGAKVVAGTEEGARTAATARAQETIAVFSPEALEAAAVTLSEMPSERRAAGVRTLQNARVNYGRRSLPHARQAIDNLEAKKSEFENLLQPIERLQEDLVLAAAMPAPEFRLSPMLLLGEPGIGKTFLASQLADALGVPSEKISAGGGHGSFQLTGSHSTWTGAQPGAVAALLAKSAFAAPVLVIDEVDKLSDGRHPLLPVLLDLLDAGTAKRFRDEYFEMELDASRMVVVLTANDIGKVPVPLLSRVQVFTVPAPQPAQRLRIIEQTMAALVRKTGHCIGLAPGAPEQLSQRMDIDLRQLHRLVSAAFASALQAGSAVASIKQPDALGASGLSGFNLAGWEPSKGQLC